MFHFLTLFGRWSKKRPLGDGGSWKTTIKKLFVQSLQVVCKSHPFHVSYHPESTRCKLYPCLVRSELSPHCKSYRLSHLVPWYLILIVSRPSSIPLASRWVTAWTAWPCAARAWSALRVPCNDVLRTGKAWRVARCLPAMTCVCLGDQVRYNKRADIEMIGMCWMSSGCRGHIFRVC